MSIVDSSILCSACIDCSIKILYILMETNNFAIQVNYTVTPNATVTRGSAIAIHYDSAGDGAIDYERSTIWPRTPGVSLHDLYGAPMYDDGWQPDHKIQFGGLSSVRSNVALHIVICGNSFTLF